MNIFFKKICAFLIVGIVAAYSLQWIIDTGLKKSGYSVDYNEWYEIMHSKINAEIIIQGSSTARIQISPEYLEQQFKLSAYNMGISGATFPFELYKFNEYIKLNKKPRYIIQVIDANTLTHAIDVDFVQFIPYLNYDLVNKFRNHILFTEKDLYIPLFKYSHRIGAVTAGLDHLFDKNVQSIGTYKGFQTYNGHYNKSLIDKMLKNSTKGFFAPFNDTIYRQFIHFADYCKKRKISLIMVYAPAQADFQKKLLNNDSVANWYRKIAKRYDFKFFDYSNNLLSRDTSMYLDYFHLNNKGVKLFNEALVKDLKTVIK